MTAYNNHTLSQGAIAVARESAAREQREKDAALLRRLATQREEMAAVCVEEAAEQEEHAAQWLRAAADLIEAGEQ